MIDDDYDIIAIHMLTNDVRNFSPETCVDKHAEGSDTLSVDQNIDIFIKVQNFILKSKRFTS